MKAVIRWWIRRPRMIPRLRKAKTGKGLGKLLAEQPDRRGIGNAVLDAQPQKLRERQPITCLILHLLVRKIVERLQNQHPKHHDRVERLPASATLPHLIRCQHHSLYVDTKALPG